MNETLLDVRGLKVHFPIEKGLVFKRRVGYVRAVDGVDLRIAQGRGSRPGGRVGLRQVHDGHGDRAAPARHGGQVFFEGKDLGASRPGSCAARGWISRSCSRIPTPP